MRASAAVRASLPATALAYSAAGAAATALLCAALNLLEPAGYLLLGAVACLALHLLFFLYLRLPEADRDSVLSRQVIRRTAVVSSLLAVGVSCTHWYAGWWFPLDDVPPRMHPFLAHHWRKLDLVPAIFAQLLPASWESGFHHYFRHPSTYCFPGAYWWESMRYLRAAIPGYFLAFFGMILLARLGAASARQMRR
jgi:hypothetical protein